MPDLLLELFSEEIPARMQGAAARDLERLVVGALSDRGLLFEGIKAFAGPRRLTLAVSGLPAKQADVREEVKGPKVDAPAAAIDGFLKKTGLAKDRLRIEKTAKGDVYIAVIEREGRETAAVLAEILPEAMAKLPWPKSMRWKPGVATRWVRPLHSILCTFDGEVVPFSFAGVSSGRHTRGHRFLAPEKIEVRRFDDYTLALKKAFVALDAEERAAIIFEGVKQAAFVHGLELIPDEGLLAEVAGLVEWPVILTGTIEYQFMDVPPEILQTSMRTHQKYFALRDPRTGKMANRFELVANMVAEDGGKEIVAGNERVLRARLSDAKFFWDEDRKRSLESRVADLKGIIFHAKLGTQYERVERIAALAGEIARKIGADPEKAKRAARLAKADLTSGVVGEFPELQGVMGRYYALNDKEDAEIADAIRDHYKPVGPSDAVPTGKIAISVALADKLDQLIGFFAILLEPTGSSDPYALRRAALGVIRILITHSIGIRLTNLIGGHARRALSEIHTRNKHIIEHLSDHRAGPEEALIEFEWRKRALAAAEQEAVLGDESVALAVLGFLTDRLSVGLSSDGLRKDCVRAVFLNARDLTEEQLPDGNLVYQNDNIVLIAAATRALQAFLKTDDGANLLAGYKRAANILKDEEKKDNNKFTGKVNEKKLAEPAEKTLYAALAKARAQITPALAAEDFAGAMHHMAALRVPVDAFFDQVKVNAPDPKLRENRLHLMAALRATIHQIGDFSKIESPQVAKR